ncbi:MAG: PfkB family carbohydrate kinase [Opitutaceae bacterium]|jgi:sugar/nucleoside kinase (ribokinase family)
MHYDIVVFGNYTKDTIVKPTGTSSVDGGGFNYGAHVAAMMGLKTAAVTRLAREDIRVVEALARLGIDVYPAYTPDSTVMRLYYPTSNPDERVLTVTKTAGSFTPDQFADLSARAFLINASIRGEVGLDVILELDKKGGLLVADLQGFIRVVSPDGTLKFEPWPEREEVLAHVDILKTDIVEAEALTGEKDMKKAARRLAGFGPTEIVLTHRDGVLVLAQGEFFEAPFLPRSLVGRSGRGDTCIASYVGKRLTAPPAEATVWAAAATTLKLEAEGPIRRTKADVEALIRKSYASAPARSPSGGPR